MRFFLMFAMTLAFSSVHAAVTPDPGWADSYSVGNECYIDSTFDHDVGSMLVQTPHGSKTVRQIARALGPGPGKAGNPQYNTVNCGHAPYNSAWDEQPQACPGRVDQGPSGCMTTGPRWNLARAYPVTAASPTQAAPAAPSNTEAPSPPTGLSVAIYSSTAAELLWTAVAPASRAGGRYYEIEQNGAPVRSTGDANVHSHYMSNLLPATEYHWRVRLTDGAGTFSEWVSVTGTTNPGAGSAHAKPVTIVSAPATAGGLMAAPIGLRVAIYSATAAELFWSAVDGVNPAGGLNYEIQQNGERVRITEDANVRSHFMNNLTPATEYNWRVRLSDGKGGNGPWAGITGTSNTGTSGASTVTGPAPVPVNTSPPPPQVPGRGTLYSIHTDMWPDPDDLQFIIMARMIIDKNNLPHMVVVGTYGENGPHLSFVNGAVGHVRSLFPAALDAHNNVDAAVASMAAAWSAHIRAGGTVAVIEAGPSDRTARALRLMPADVDRKQIIVYQHSAGSTAFNEAKTLPANLAYVKAQTSYRVVPNGNVGGNGSADFQEPSTSAICQRFMQAAMQTRYSEQWTFAFSMIGPNRQCDGSDTVELLAAIGEDSIRTFDDFAERFFR